MATYDLTRERVNYDMLQIGDIINVPYSGQAQKIELPPGQYKLEVWGAQGGDWIYNKNWSSSSKNYTTLLQYESSAYYGDRLASASGGKGGYSYGTLTLNDYTILYCYCGGCPQATYTSARDEVDKLGNQPQFNGGGYFYSYAGGINRPAGGGGTDIRLGADSLYARIIVAGGGSSPNGTTNSYYGGMCDGAYGGGETGGPGKDHYGNARTDLAGSQTSAGLNGGFGYGAINNDGNGSYHWYGWFRSSPGGGWYGGGWDDGSNSQLCGGGSGYVYTNDTASNYPDGCLLNSDYYLTNAATIGGNQTITEPDNTSSTGHQGDGYCRITVLKVSNNSYIYARNSSFKTMKTAVITTAPTKVSYSNNELFDPTGMTITVTYNDNTTETVIPDFKSAEMPVLSTGQTSVKISYNNNGNGITLTQAITVS